MNEVLKSQILKKIKPSKNEDLIFKKKVEEFISKLELSSKKLNYNCDFFIGGSFGKGTYLKGNFDVDIFCRFNLKYEGNEISNYLKLILVDLKIEFKIEKGSRDYFKIFFIENKIKIIFEIIPIIKIDKYSKGSNSTDQSPFHVEFLKSKLKSNPKLCDEIRLAKQYFKAKKLYGAESYVQGFSGHVIDNLIIYYLSLENLILKAKNWRENKFLDVNNFYENSEIAISKLEDDKISNLILIDPIIKTRNAARALSKEKYFEFLFIVNTFEKFESKDFIIKTQSYESKILDAKKFSKKSNLDFLIYEMDFILEKDGDDIVGSKMLKIFRKIETYFKELDFQIFKLNFEIDFNSNKILFIYYFENIQLSNILKLQGPKVFMEDAVEKFLDKNNSKFFLENSRVYIYKKRKVSNLKEIYKLNLSDLKKFTTKDISFIKKINILNNFK